jgi:hypothetical protein
MGWPSLEAGERVTRGVPWWLRLFLLVNVVQDIAIGLSGWLSPTRSLLPLKGLTPLNGRFIASLYLGGGVVILVAALVRRAVDARLALCSFLVITLLVLVMTLVYWREFTRGGIPWQWMTTYVADPVVCLVALVALRLGPPARPGRHRLSAPFLTVAAVLGVVGVAMLTAAPGVLRAWPWTLTPLLSRVYAAFFLAFAVGAALAAGERRKAAVAGIVAGLLVMFCLSLAVSLVHLSRFDVGAPRWVWFGVHGTLIALAATSGLSLRHPHQALASVRQ